MSKFVAEDVPLFLSLIDDLFPGLKAERSQFPEFSKALEKVWCLLRWNILLLSPLLAIIQRLAAATWVPIILY